MKLSIHICGSYCFIFIAVSVELFPSGIFEVSVWYEKQLTNMTAEMAIIAPMVFFISHKLKIHTHNAATLNLLLNSEKMPLEFGGINPGCVHLTECVFLIITDVVSFQKRFVFIVKTPFPVMFFLFPYVVYGLVKQ